MNLGEATVSYGDPGSVAMASTFHLTDKHKVPQDGTQKYTTLGLIGSGGMGVVIQAFDHDIGRTVALKRPKAKPGDDIQAAFLLEARLTGQLSHPNIVPVYEVVVTKSETY